MTATQQQIKKTLQFSRLTGVFCIFVFLKCVTLATIAFSQSTLDKTDPNEYLEPFPLSIQYQKGGIGRNYELRPNTILHSGDEFFIKFTPREESYVYIFLKDSAGQHQLLFPMNEFDGMLLNHHNPVQPGHTYILPRKDITFILDSHTGFEVLTLIVKRTRNPEIDSLDNLAKQILNGEDKQEEVEKKIAQVTTEKKRGILAQSGVRESSPSFPEDGNEHNIAKEYEWWMNDMCDGCYYQIIFEHRD